ncbi:MAG: Ig-like domain-containing protein, partial [Rhizomicrobium sp.]
MTLKNPSSFTIPNFSSSTCSFAASTLDKAFAGSTGNYLVLNLNGTLSEPPPPAATSSTSLSASPTSPQVQGTAVTLTAIIKKTTGALATSATGTMNFNDRHSTGASTVTTVVGTAPVSGGTASLTISTLPRGSNSLTATFSGDSSYKGSTSSPLSYSIAPAPTVQITGLPSTTFLSGTTTFITFEVKLTNPASG